VDVVDVTSRVMPSSQQRSSTESASGSRSASGSAAADCHEHQGRDSGALNSRSFLAGHRMLEAHHLHALECKDNALYDELNGGDG
jgi:hypothetical protein